VETVERWWNGRYGTEPDEHGSMDDLRRDVRLLTDGEFWRVEVCLGGRDGEFEREECGNETYARTVLARCLETGGDGWRQV
jgi:hypothetical protein